MPRAINLKSSKWMWISGLCASIGLVTALVLADMLDESTASSRAATSSVATDKLPSLKLDLLQPDAVISTQSLSQLPRDVLSVPILNTLLTEDFVYYYEENESRLGLRGAIRRIAYEHDMNIGDEIVSYALNTPARIALWKTQDGKLGNFMMVIDRGSLAKSLELLAKAALNDSQLKIIGSVPLQDGDKVKVYGLNYAGNRTLYFADYHGRLFIFSDERMALPPKQKKKPSDYSKIRALLTSDPAEDQDPYLRRFDLTGIKTKHTIALSGSYASFGYQYFFPALRALRFDFGDKGWDTYAMLDGAKARISHQDTRKLWSAAPIDPSLCVALPIEASRAEGVIKGLAFGNEGFSQQMLASVQGPSAICWYSMARMYAPLLVMKTNSDAQAEKYLETVFGNVVGKRVKKGKGPKTPISRLRKISRADGAIWYRDVASHYGMYERTAKDANGAELVESYYRPTLAYVDKYLLFSPDPRLVDQAVGVLDKKYPALSDQLPGEGNISLVAYPASLTKQMQDSMLESLPAESEQALREAVVMRFFPVLDRFKKYPPYVLNLPANAGAGGIQWERLEWRALSSH